MKNTKETGGQWWRISGSVCLAAVIAWLVLSGMTLVSLADVQGTVIPASAKIRQSADTGSEQIGSVSQGGTVDIISQTTGADGYTWYKVYVDAATTGYIRSDLVNASGTVPTETVSVTPAATATPSSTDGSVTALQPITAAVNSDNVRIRSNASTSGEIITTVNSDIVLTIVGQAADSEGKTWYQVQFSAEGGDVSGFVREDFVTLQGEIVPAETTASDTPEDTPEDTGSGNTENTPVSEVSTPDYETEYDGEWYLLDNKAGERYKIADLFNVATTNAKLYQESLATIKSQKIVILILVILVIALVLGVTILLFKIKDIKDSAYFEAVEKEALRKRQETRSARADRKVMPRVGAEGKTVNRSASASQQKTAAPKQTEARTAAPRQAASQQTANKQSAPRQAAGPVEKKTVQSVQKPAQSAPKPQPKAAPRNFIADDDEFEFEFLNWDGEDGK